MQLRTVWTIGCLVLAMCCAGCSSGQTGSIGGVDCNRDDDCRERMQEVLAELAKPFAQDRVLLGSECLTPERVEALASAPPIDCERGDEREACEVHEDHGWLAQALRCGAKVCACYLGWDGDTERRLRNALLLRTEAETPCLLRGRTGDCLLAADTFEGCDPDQADSCNDACSHADALLRADAARRVEAELRAARCEQTFCQSVFRVEGHCFAGWPDSRGQNRFDCSLSDADILQRGYPQPSDSTCGEEGCASHTTPCTGEECAAGEGVEEAPTTCGG